MIVQATQTAPPHFFLVGARAAIGTDADLLAKRVGTVVTRSKLDSLGQQIAAGDVALVDVPFPGQPAEGPFRFESDIAPYKPYPDIVVVAGDHTNVPPALPVAFGSVRVDRGSGFGPIANLNFGWALRGEAPRLALAGRENPPPADGSTLSEFDGERHLLPLDYSNSFQNGQIDLGVGSPFITGDRIRFTPLVGPTRTFTIPAAPPLRVTENGEVLNPPLLVNPRVDTVVYALPEAELTLVWRATFLWEERFVSATLEIG